MATQNCHSGHPLVWTTDYSGYSGHGFICDVCESTTGDTGTPRYACVACQYDVCRNCRPAPNSAQNQLVCKAGHTLVWSANSTGYSTHDYGCDLCGSTGNTDLGRYVCIPCQYDVCPRCCPAPTGAKDPKERCGVGHLLVWTTNSMGYRGNLYSCNLCHKNGDITQGRFACICCQYDICPKCRPKLTSEERKGNNSCNPGCQGPKSVCKAGHTFSCSVNIFECTAPPLSSCDTSGAASQNTDKGRYARIKCKYDVCHGRHRITASISHVVAKDKPVSVEQLGQSMQELHVSERQKKPTDQSEEEKKTCKICFRRPVDTAFSPCGHRGTCHVCAAGLEICPFCGRNIQTALEIFDM